MQAMFKLVLLFFFMLLAGNPIAQKTMEAFPITEQITIDGEFLEESWKNAQPVGNFIQYRPKPGDQATQNTEVKLMYDDDAIYIGVICYDDPSLVSKILSLRDDFNANVDNVQVSLDTYNDDQNAFVFGVSSMGVQFDSKLTATTESVELNMIWHSEVIHTEQGWQIEIRIPYSAFRFPKVDVQDWGINFYRYISRNREESLWSPISPDFDNWIAQSGSLTNLKGIEPPVRLAFMPYVSAYADHYRNPDPDIRNWQGSFNGGMDIKLGLNEAFTLDMTLVPDFGQVVFDNQVLNLSPFEIQFNENRQFFTEGNELFTKAGLFYSRRIGVQSPYSVLSTNLDEGESLEDVPANAQLYNATKVSGRTKSGLGIGVFNGITAKQSATAVNNLTGARRKITAAPLTNYNVLVLDQNLKNNSFVTLTNTNVMREGHFYDANVTGLNTRINLKENNYFIGANTALSNKFSANQIVTGHNWGVSTGKQKGSFVFSTSYFEESDTYDPNDLGFNANNNKRNLNASVGYRVFNPFWKLNQLSSSVGVSYNRLYNPNVYTGTFINANLFVNSQRFHAAGFNFNCGVTDEYDYFEPRTPGRYFISPTWFEVSPWISSNYQKRLAIDSRITYSLGSRNNWTTFSYNFSPRIRISDKVFLVYDWSQAYRWNAQGYAIAFGTPAVTSNEIIFGSRDVVETTNTIDLRYTLTNKMGVTFRLRHYRSALQYDRFYYLNEDGRLTPNDLDGLDAEGESVYNTNFNAFTIDFVYRWVFLPGSEINIVWKNSIFSSDKEVAESYVYNLSTMFENAPLNSFSIKVLYWLDYQSLKRKK